MIETMKRRRGQLRRRVVATAVVGFVLLWTVVFVQMATGNDPALGTGTATRSAAKQKRLPSPQRRSLQPAVPPPSEREDDESTPVETEPSEAGIEAERAEVERIEIERLEAEAREREELEPLTTGQS
ncbi:MAG TPA: hypothetical protein VHI77_11065 [Solirubrobacterales bacterium]|nr:hypothetical protein [Solirubrobacterales bacterium]